MRREIFIYEILLLSGSDIGLKQHQFPIKALHNTQLSLNQKNIYIYIYVIHRLGGPSVGETVPEVLSNRVYSDRGHSFSRYRPT